MKKFLIVLLIALLSSGIYVSAKSISNPTYDVVDSEDNFVGRFYRQNIAPRFKHYYFTSEEHEQIIEKRIELTKQYLTNYENMSSEEKQQAEDIYYSNLKVFILDLTGETVDPNLFENRLGGRMHERVDQNTHELIMGKRVELTLKYLSDYSSLTDEEKATAIENYRTDFHDFMSSLREEFIGSCHGYGRIGGQQKGRFGRRP